MTCYFVCFNFGFPAFCEVLSSCFLFFLKACEYKYLFSLQVSVTSFFRTVSAFHVGSGTATRSSNVVTKRSQSEEFCVNWSEAYLLVLRTCIFKRKTKNKTQFILFKLATFKNKSAVVEAVGWIRG